ncbi:uncharacterized protein LOC124420804 [Lucilia cuprina]|uniref:uncharacterized protein LOC124420804 n=1 Tax=Lucilia cuprina TaxID=7375 RepID=UPI001F05EE50|nr:uncharacterized protein LOC124420804 [Lucilia cuprina]
MEELKSTVTTLTGAINRFMEQIKVVENRISNVETCLSNDALGQVLSRLERLENSQAAATCSVVLDDSPLQRPRTESDLKDISRLPDSVKELRSFEGNPTQYISWVHSVETVLKDFVIVKEKPIYRAILQSVRQKIIGAADTALISYNVFDSDWAEIKRILSLHYADKRDVQTLEHQLNQLSQGSSTVDEFYSTINRQLSLIINKLKTESYSVEIIRALVETYRNRSLDIFIRGLMPELSRMIIIQRPTTLPEAYSACLELQNLTMRNNILYTKAQDLSCASTGHGSGPSRPPKSFPMRSGWQSQNSRPKNWQHNPTNNFSSSRANAYTPNKPDIPPRYPAIKYEPMETDRSIQSRRVNYINNPRTTRKRAASEIHIINKQPRRKFYGGRPSSPPYIEYNSTAGDVLCFLIDTGSNKNFCSPRLSKGSIPLEKPISVKSVGGNVNIERKVVGSFFKFVGIDEPIHFYVLPELKTFDGIIGDDTLKELGALVDRKKNILVLKNHFQIPLKEKVTIESNYILDDEYIPKIRIRIESLITKYKPLFGPLDGSELASSNVQAEIRTTTEEPIYTKSYPYPVCMREEVERQITELLSEGVIRPSKSPYNSPIWVVLKKPKPNGEKQYRMVVDFKRLNSVTIPDTYPIPDITSTLASLGKAKYFTTIDLTSGFHQIAMKPRDIQKTAFSTANASEGMDVGSDDTLTASEGRDDDELSSGATVHSAERDASDLIPH